MTVTTKSFQMQRGLPKIIRGNNDHTKIMKICIQNEIPSKIELSCSLPRKTKGDGAEEKTVGEVDDRGLAFEAAVVGKRN